MPDPRGTGMTGWRNGTVAGPLGRGVPGSRDCIVHENTALKNRASTKN